MFSSFRLTGYSPDINQCQTRNIMKRAFRVWEEVTDLSFSEVGVDDTADIIIYFGYSKSPACQALLSRCSCLI